MSEEKKANGLWLKKDKNGNDYLSGKLPNGSYINIFKNTRKTEGSKQPDYTFLINEPRDSTANQDTTREGFM